MGMEANCLRSTAVSNMPSYFDSALFLFGVVRLSGCPYPKHTYTPIYGDDRAQFSTQASEMDK